MGYRCAPGVTIFYYNFLDTFLHQFNVKTGPINSDSTCEIIYTITTTDYVVYFLCKNIRAQLIYCRIYF